MQKIPFHDLGGTGPLVHFAHANSYPPGSYRRMLDPVKQHFRITAIEHRPLWPEHTVPPLRSVWDAFGEDLIRFMDQHQLSGIPGVGHSLGAVVTLFAAVRRPDLFSKIILLDPVFFSEQVALASAITPMFMKRRNPWIRKTLQRPAFWTDRKEAYDFHRSKRAFSEVPDPVLRDYIDAGTADCEGGVRLRYSPEWEARVYCSIPFIWRRLAACGVPVFAVRGEHSNVLSEAVWARWQREHPQMQFSEIPGAGHLFPLERPQETAELVLENLLA